MKVAIIIFILGMLIGGFISAKMDIAIDGRDIKKDNKTLINISLPLTDNLTMPDFQGIGVGVVDNLINHNQTKKEVK
jgi:hypothetical protein